ncbi:MAG: TIGR04086 family membrane protein [Peptococcaceae bacterium]|nr:TIGR04086 family membrane protein [Peptococcaceae bacterium]
MARMLPRRGLGRGGEVEQVNFQGLSVIKGTVAALLLSMLLFAIVSLLFAYTALADRHMSLVATISGVFSILWGGSFAARLAGRSALLYGSLVGLLYSLAVLALGAFVLTEPIAAEVLWRVGGAIVCGGIGGLFAPKARASLRKRK